jgi:hypothetical protein
MSLDPRVLAELEERGLEKVSAMLDSHAADKGPFIRLGITDCPDPRPFEVEFWLRETLKELEANKLSARRHEEQLTETRRSSKWGRAAFWAAAALVLLAIFDHFPKLG